MTWNKIPGTTIVHTGGIYRINTLYERTSGSTPDSEIIHQLETSLSYTELEDEIEQAYGTQVTLKSITARKVRTDLYEHSVEFHCDQNLAPAIAIIAIKIVGMVVFFIGGWFLVDKLMHFAEGASDTFEEYTETQQNTMLILAVIIVIFLILMAIRK